MGCCDDGGPCGGWPPCPTTATITAGGFGFPVTDEVEINGVDYLLATPERRAAGQMSAVLSQLEWGVRETPYWHCPACRGVRPDPVYAPEGDFGVGHGPDCYLAAAIRAARGEVSADGDE